MEIASCRPKDTSSPFWWIDFVELWQNTFSERVLWNIPVFDQWTSEVIQHIQQTFVGVAFLGPSQKKEENYKTETTFLGPP